MKKKGVIIRIKKQFVSNRTLREIHEETPVVDQGALHLEVPVRAGATLYTLEKNKSDPNSERAAYFNGFFSVSHSNGY